MRGGKRKLCRAELTFVLEDHLIAILKDEDVLDVGAGGNDELAEDPRAPHSLEERVPYFRVERIISAIFVHSGNIHRAAHRARLAVRLLLSGVSVIVGLRLVLHLLCEVVVLAVQHDLREELAKSLVIHDP